MFQFGVLVFLALGFLACSNSDDSKKGGLNPAADEKTFQDAWSQIPAEYNPNIETAGILLDSPSLQKIDINLFGFNSDFQLRYQADLPKDSAKLEIYSVSKNAKTSVRGVSIRGDRGVLRINRTGNYQCSLSAENGRITSLEGACYVRVVLTLPQGSQLEVYNVGQRVSARFHAMDNASFLKALDDESWADRKMALIDSYLESYSSLGKKPTLDSTELRTVLKSFMTDEQKIVALSKLHAHLLDRENLGKLIDDEFGYFSREKARKAVGLP